jgi:hypothetical protein
MHSVLYAWKPRLKTSHRWLRWRVGMYREYERITSVAT